MTLVDTRYNNAFEKCHVCHQFIPGSVTTLGGGAFFFDSADQDFYTPYNIIAYVDESVPAGWSHYFSGHEIYQYTKINPGLGSGCSRSKFENEISSRSGYWGNH